MILVTGGAGYIGSHCVLDLIKNGYDVIIFDNLELGHLETVETLKSMNYKGKVVDLIIGNLQNISDIDNALKNNKIEAVIHFAAYSQVNESMKDPEKYYRNNVLGTLNLLDAMRKNGVKKIVFSSTAATYGEPKYTPIDEDHPQIPINPYGMSKLMIEHIMDDFDKAYDIKSVRLRYFNVIGADSECRIGEWHEPETHLVPNILKSVLSTGKEFSLFGTDYKTRDGTCIRDYVNVEDLADAHILALKYLENGGATDFFNLGTNDGNTVREIFSECEKITGKKIPLKICERREGDPAVLVGDNTKAKKVLGWAPTRTLSDSIRTAYQWELKRSLQ